MAQEIMCCEAQHLTAGGKQYINHTALRLIYLFLTFILIRLHIFYQPGLFFSS